VSADKPFPHVCLAGCKVSRDWFLIRRLELQHAVTLIEDIEKLNGNSVLKIARVLVLDCTDCSDSARNVMPLLRTQFPDLCVVVVEGTYAQKEVVSLFQHGIRDYFPAPYDLELLTQRVASLCSRPMQAR
jgi:DNA-binding NtrC family response regulator